MKQEQKKQVAGITILITGIFMIFIGFAYAFLNQNLLGTKRQVITAGRLQLELGEEEEITLENALPMYDEVGMVQNPFIFKVHNKNTTDIDYTLSLKDATTSSEKLDPSIIKYGLSTDGYSEIANLSDTRNNEIGSGSIFSGETVTYELRLWIDSKVTDENLIKGKSASYKIEINITAELDSEEDKVLLSSMKQGDYVAYVGNNGCQNNGTDITGTSNAESKNSCLGWNANQTDTDTETFGYCQSSGEEYITTGWRIAYIEDNYVYLTSAGAPECLKAVESEGNKNYIEISNKSSRKYCNVAFSAGTCKENSWAMGDEDFYKITSAMNNGNGKHLTSYYSSSEGSYCHETSTEECGLGRDLIQNGGYYNFAATSGVTDKPSVYWWAQEPARVRSLEIVQPYGLRPVLRLSQSVYVTGGTGTMNDPYTISNIGFKINEQSAETSHTKVVLNLSAEENVTEMCISNNRTCTNYEPFATTKEWNLLPGNGIKTIYVYYKDNAGKIVARFKQEIRLSEEAPTIKIEESDSLKRKITISAPGTDAMCFSNQSENVENCSEWVDYSRTYIWRLSVYNGEKKVYAFFKDFAGNITSTSAVTSCNNCEPFTLQEDFSDAQVDPRLTLEANNSNGESYTIADGRLKVTAPYKAPFGGSASLSFKVTPNTDGILSFDYGLEVKVPEWAVGVRIKDTNGNSKYLGGGDYYSGGTGDSGTMKDIELKADVTYTISMSVENRLRDEIIAYFDNINIGPAS